MRISTRNTIIAGAFVLIAAFVPIIFNRSNSRSKSNSFSPTAAAITELGNRVINGRDWRSYLQLLKWENDVDSVVLKRLISTELDKINDVYRNPVLAKNIERTGFICIYLTTRGESCSKGYEPPRGFSAWNVLEHLDRNKYSFWQERARAACLLRYINTSPDKDNVKPEDVYEGLIKVMKQEYEPDLLVSKMALDTYSKLVTNFKPTGVFDFQGAIDDWNDPQRRKEILSREW